MIQKIMGFRFIFYLVLTLKTLLKEYISFYYVYISYYNFRFLLIFDIILFGNKLGWGK